MPMQSTAVVIGSGIVGLCCAAFLQEAGYQVSIIDPLAPGEGASAGNPGGISRSSIVPASSPGVLQKVPGWLLDPEGPLTMRWQHLPWMIPWLSRFLRNGTQAKAAQSMAALATLTEHARSAYTPILRKAGSEDLIRDLGHLMVYRSQASFHAEDASWKRRRDLGVAFDVLDQSETLALEPALDPSFSRARIVTGNSQISDPLLFCQRLAAAITGKGGVFHRQRATDFVRSGNRIVGVKTESAEHPATVVVVAGGAHSAKLASRLSDRILLQPERGYNVTLTNPPFALTRPVFSTEDKLMAASMGPGLRFAGTAEFAGFSTPPNWKRAETLHTVGKRLFPALRTDAVAEKTLWTGNRPSTPDSLPVIGPSPKWQGVFYAFGHGHIGLTTGAITGQIIAALAQGNASPVSLQPFRPDRF